MTMNDVFGRGREGGGLGRKALAMLPLGMAILVAAVCFLFLHSESVEPGFHGVVVDKPYFFGHEGVRKEPLREGRLWLWRTSSMYKVRVQNLSLPVKVDDYSSADNILLDFETTIQFNVSDAVDLISRFGTDWFDNNVKQQYLAVVREQVKKKTMTAMMSDVNAAKDVDSEVTKGLEGLVKELKLPVRIVGVSLGRAKPNETVLAQMNETAAQQQRKKTLVEAEAAEVQREKEQSAKAVADNAYRRAIGLSPQEFLALEHMKRWTEACAKAHTCVVNPNGQVLNISAATGK